MPGWLGWTVGYALVVWGVDALLALLEPWLKKAPRRAQDIAEGVRVLIPVGLAFLIGFWLRSWWWVLSPFVATLVTMLTFSLVDYLRLPQAKRQQAAAGLIIGIGVTTFEAGLAALGALAGVAIGRWWPGG